MATCWIGANVLGCEQASRFAVVDVDILST